MSKRNNIVWEILRIVNRIRITIKKLFFRFCRRKEIEQLDVLLDKDVSIISSNCFAGGIYQDLHRSYYSPTAGLFFPGDDFVLFLQNLEANVNGKGLRFVKSSKYPEANERRNKQKRFYPIALLNNSIEIHFLHYKSEKEASMKWERRCKRINIEKLIVIGMQQNWCSEKTIERFDQLKFKNKFFFSTLVRDDLKSNIFMPQFKGEIGDAFNHRRKFYRELIARLNSKSKNF